MSEKLDESAFLWVRDCVGWKRGTQVLVATPGHANGVSVCGQRGRDVIGQRFHIG